jgi:hypothetical protein
VIFFFVLSGLVLGRSLSVGERPGKRRGSGMVNEFNPMPLRLAWGMWVVGVIAVHVMPRALKHLTHSTGSPHHTLHFLAFAGVAIGASSWAPRVGEKLVVCTSVIGLCAMLELLQHYFYGNAYEWADLRDDSFGAIAGSLAVPAIASLIRIRKNRAIRSRPDIPPRRAC